MVKETAECKREDEAGCLVRLRSKSSRKLKACLSCLNTFVLSNLAVPPRTVVPVSWLITTGSLYVYLCDYSVKTENSPGENLKNREARLRKKDQEMFFLEDNRKKRIEKRRKDLKFPVCLKTKKPNELHTERACSVIRYSTSPLTYRLCFVRNKA